MRAYPHLPTLEEVHREQARNSMLDQRRRNLLFAAFVDQAEREEIVRRQRQTSDRLRRWCIAEAARIDQAARPIEGQPLTTIPFSCPAT